MSAKTKIKLSCRARNKTTGKNYDEARAIELRAGTNELIFEVTGEHSLPPIPLKGVPPGPPLSKHVQLSWVVEVNEKGETKFGGSSKSKGPGKDTSDVADLKVEAKAPGANEKCVKVTASLKIDEAGLKIPKVDIEIGEWKASDEETFQWDLVLPKLPAPAPPKPPAIPTSYLMAAPIMFPENRFSPTNDSVSKLKSWVGELQDLAPLGEVIAAGKVPLMIQAFASTTGTASTNKWVTDKRAAVAKTVLSSIFQSSALKFQVLSYGKEKADGQGKE